MTTHHYAASLRWDGHGTRDYATYERKFRIAMAGKPALVGSADAVFRGDPSRHSPEDLLLDALTSCHMLSYLALCARRGIDVLAYTDHATGEMTGGRFVDVQLRPRVVIAPGGDAALARALHEAAHAECYIARSCNFAVRCEPSIVPEIRRDIAILLEDKPGALARLGEALGAAGVSVEGGGGFDGVVHFLVADAEAAAAATTAAGFKVLGVRDVITVRLDQERPGQLGAIARAMSDAGVNILSMYSDHDHQLILCADDMTAAERVARAWSS